MIFTSEREGPVGVYTLSPDGERFAYASHSGLVVRDAGVGRKLAEFRGSASSVDALAFSLDGRRLAAAYGGGGDPLAVVVWDIAAPDERAATPCGHTQRVTDYGFSPDGKRIVSGSQDDSLILWDAETGAQLKTLMHPTKDNLYPVGSCRFAARGKRVVSHDAGGLHVYDTRSGNEVWGLYASIVWSAVSPDGDTVFLAECGNSEISVHDAFTGEKKRTIGGLHPFDQIDSFALSPDGRRLATISGDFVMSFSPDGSRLAARFNENAIVVWDVATGRRWFTYLPRGKPTAPNWSPDGRDILFGTTAGAVHLMRLEGQGHLPEEGRTGQPPAPTDDPALVQGVAVEDAGGA